MQEVLPSMAFRSSLASSRALSFPYLADLRAMLDSYGLDRVYAWGHPDGLEGGTNEAAYDDMIRSFDHAQAIGAKVMRVVGSSLQFRNQPHQPQLERLAADVP